MKIKRIYLKDFRLFDEFEIDFTTPQKKTLDLVVFAGPNGCGKTSLLHACLLALEKEELINTSTLNDIRIGTDKYTIALTVEENGIEQIIKKSSNMNEKRKEKLLNSTQVDYFSSWREPKLVGSLPITAGKKGNRLKETEQNRLWLIKQSLINLTARKAFESQNLFEDELSAKFDLIVNVWKDFYPMNTDTFEVKPVSEKIEEGFDLYLKRENGDMIPIDALSAGEIEVFSMIGWFVIRKTRNNLVFIDEPELHLHPALHRIVLRSLQKLLPNTQIICATHSQEILDSVFSYQIKTILLSDDLAECEKKSKNDKIKLSEAKR